MGQVMRGLEGEGLGDGHGHERRHKVVCGATKAEIHSKAISRRRGTRCSPPSIGSIWPGMSGWARKNPISAQMSAAGVAWPVGTLRSSSRNARSRLRTRGKHQSGQNAEHPDIGSIGSLPKLRQRHERAFAERVGIIIRVGIEQLLVENVEDGQAACGFCKAAAASMIDEGRQ